MLNQSAMKLVSAHDTSANWSSLKVGDESVLKRGETEEGDNEGFMLENLVY